MFIYLNGGTTWGRTREPSPYQDAALPTELQSHLKYKNKL